MDLKVEGIEGVEFTIPESDPVPTSEELTKMDTEFREACPTGYEKVNGTISEANLFVPRNSYQYNGIQLTPIITGYAVENEVVQDKGSRGLYDLTEDEAKIVKALADKNKPFAFHQREV